MHSKCVDDASLFYFNYKVVISSHHDSSQCVCSFLPTFNSSHVQHILNIVACLPIPCMQVSLTYYSHSQRSCPAAKYHKNNFPRIHYLSSGLAGISTCMVSSMITLIRGTMGITVIMLRNFWPGGWGSENTEQWWWGGLIRSRLTRGRNFLKKCWGFLSRDCWDAMFQSK